MLNIRQGGHADLEKYYTLMEMDFDSEEMLPKIAIHKALMNHTMELLVIYDEDTRMDISYALLVKKGVYGYVLLKYMAVMPWYRGKGFGKETMRMLNRRYADTQGIIAEITDFPDDDPDHQRKLFKFFARFGYVEVPSDYRISGTTAHVYVKPLKGGWDISPVLHRIIKDFYERCLTPVTVHRMIDIKPVAK